MRISDWISDVCASDLIILALFLLCADPAKNGKRDYLIVLLQCHAPNTCRGAALEFAHISGGEANGLALPCGEQHVVALSQQCDPDQAIGCALIKAHCDLAVEIGRAHV